MLKRYAAIVLLAVLSTFVGPAGAVQYGAPDGQGHPWVGLVSFHDAAGVPLWRCTGSLIDEDTFLTAAHCTQAPAVRAVMWFDAGPVPIAAGWTPRTACAGFTGYPCTGDAAGWPISHPGWDGGATTPNTSDVGVVQLDGARGGPYGRLAPANHLDGLATRRGQQDLELTVVGYGLQSVRPRASSIRQRLVGTVNLVSLGSALAGGYNLQYSNNPGNGHGGSGGTCFGDSGGPVLHAGQIVAVNSFVLNDNCKGSAFGYRVDTAYAQSFLDDYTAVP